MSGFVAIFPGNSPTGTSNTGSDILEANLGPVGPWSTKGILNSIPSGVVLASRNAANTADVSTLSLDGANNLTIGATGYASVIVAPSILTVQGTATFQRPVIAQNILTAQGTATFQNPVITQNLLTVQGTATFQNPVTDQATATFQQSIIIQNQPYGSQRIVANFNTSATGIATAPSQLQVPFVGGQNMAFDANIFIQAQGTGGIRAAMQAPSGAIVLVDLSGPSNGPTGFNSDLFNFTSGTSVGTGVYCLAAGQIGGLTAAGSVVGATGVNGPVIMGFMPGFSGNTCTVLANSNIFVYPST